MSTVYSFARAFQNQYSKHILSGKTRYKVRTVKTGWFSSKEVVVLQFEINRSAGLGFNGPYLRFQERGTYWRDATQEDMKIIFETSDK